ncbi:MAG: peptidase M10 [Bacteroidota bacterium]|nr:peptidase M10 [Bacteroidota bacterium]
MGEVELQPKNNLLIIHSTIYFYGNAANEVLSIQVAKDIADHWNEPQGKVIIKRNLYNLFFDIAGIYKRGLTPEMVFENINPRNNYFRIEEYAQGNISFVDGLGSNTGYFKLENLLNNSTTAAHEFGHTFGIDHPQSLDIRGQGRPAIMYPRGTLVDPEFQYDPKTRAGLTGGTMNPFTRKVTQNDIDDLKLNQLNFNKNGFAILGDFSSVWHDAQIP